MLRSIALVSVLVLAGCGGGSSAGGANDAFKTEYRAKFIANCSSAAKAQTGGNAQMATMVDKLCSCSADKMMAGASMTDLATPSTEKMTQVARECATQAGMPGMQG